MDICVWDKCNNRCKFCSNPDLPWKSDGTIKGDVYSYENLIAKLESPKFKELIGDYILMTGGEPTLQPRFLDILQYLSKNFSKQKIGVVTNGRLFSYRSFARKVLAIRGLHLGISIYGHNARAHDSVTRAKGSFWQTVSGIKNILSLRDSGHQIEIRTVISGVSYKNLGKMIEFVCGQFPSIDRLVLIFPEYEGQAVKNIKETKVTYSQVTPELMKVLPLFKKFKKIRLYHFPLCVLDPALWPYVWRTLPKEEVVFLPSCKNCSYRKYCLGIHKTYLKYVGEQEFKPIKENIKLILDKKNIKHHPIKSVK